MLFEGYRVGVVLRMIGNKSLNNNQSSSDLKTRGSAEFQTFRLFAILGALTLLFVFIVRVVHYDPRTVSKSNKISTLTGSFSDKTEPKPEALKAPSARADFISTILPEFQFEKQPSENPEIK